jgi:hypothetical protein
MPASCEHCAGTDLVRRMATYPVQLDSPLEGKQVRGPRVALRVPNLRSSHAHASRSSQSRSQCRDGDSLLPGPVALIHAEICVRIATESSRQEQRSALPCPCSA